MIAMAIAILPVFLIVTTNQEPLVCREVQVLQCSSICCNTRQGINSRSVVHGRGGFNEISRGSVDWLVKPAPTTSTIIRKQSYRRGYETKFPVHFNGLSLLARKFISGREVENNENDARYHNQRRQIIALPDYYQRDWQPPNPSLPTTAPPPAIPFQEHAAPAEKPSLPPPIAIEKPVEQVSPPQVAPPIAPPAAPPVADASPRLTTDADRIAARRAWQYFERNWNAQTGFVNSVENYRWTTWWDQGSAILGMHAAHQLGLIKTEEFNSKINRLLQTLERLPLPITGLPNKAYSTDTAQMRRLDNTPDPRGTSGWSALDMARFL
ncbi:MAG TPA: hypothetical protein DD990_21745, partial [Cyanobacteria bacterium UBA11368]|nr:hypothetical protein [Cyanobacteria bacterium UBA11368]